MKLIALSRSLHATKSSSRSSISHLHSRPFSAAAASASTAAKKYEYPKVYDPYGPRPPPSDKILGLAERIASLPPQELKQIGPALQLRLRHPRLQQISSRGLGGAGPRAGAAKAAEEKKAEEKTAFDVKLEKFDAAAKIKVIKEVRTFTNLGLKEAKELVEKVPVVLKQGVSKEEATGIIEKIKAVGGVAVME